MLQISCVHKNPFVGFFQSIKRGLSLNKSSKVDQLSVDSIISSVKQDLSSNFNNKKFSIKGSVIENLYKITFSNLMKKLHLTNEDIVKECLLQADLIDERKVIVDAKVTTIFSRMFFDTQQFIHHLCDTVLKVLGVTEVGQEAEDMETAVTKLQLYLSILSYPSVIFVGLLPVLGPAFALVATGAIIAATTLGIGVYVHCIKPCPDIVAGFTNLTTAAKRKEFLAVFGRDEEINDILSKLSHKEGVLLLGPSGVGKSEIVNGLAERIASGNVPKELKNKKVFSVNAARLAHRSTSKSLTKIEERLRGYEKDVVIFFDELHAAWKGDDQQLANCLKTFIDKFPYCIAATTNKEYQEFKIGEDKAIGRRLKIKQIAHMNQMQVETVLHNFLKTEASNIQVAPGVIEYVIEKTNQNAQEGPQPHASKMVLLEATKRVLCDPQNRLETKISHLEQEISQIKASYLHGGDFQQAASKLEELQKELDTTKKALLTREATIEQVKRVTKVWKEVKDEIFVTAFKIKNAHKKSRSCDGLKKRWVVASKVTLPALEAIIDDLASSEHMQGIKVKIDKPLIDEILVSKALVG